MKLTLDNAVRFEILYDLVTNLENMIWKCHLHGIMIVHGSASDGKCGTSAFSFGVCVHCHVGFSLPLVARSCLKPEKVHLPDPSALSVMHGAGVVFVIFTSYSTSRIGAFERPHKAPPS